MTRGLKTLSLLLSLVCAAPAQQSASASQAGQRPERASGGPGGPGGGMMMMGGGNAGQITAIEGENITVKTMMGATVTLHTSSATRFFGKDRSPIALKDLKVGDYVAGAGPPAQEGGPVEARFVAALDDAMVQRIRDFQANLGKTVIAGEIKAIDETRLTIARPDGQTQQIELDETSSLKRGRDESITLADVKVGDRVFGQGELKNGAFVPHELRVMTPGMRRGGPRGEGVLINAPPPPEEPAPTPAAPPPPE